MTKEKFRAEVNRMIAAGRGNEWLGYEKMSVYLRVGKKMIDGELRQCVQLASLVVSVPFQKKGTFTRLLEDLTQMTLLPIYVEQIMNREFFASLLKRGFRPPNNEEGEVWNLVLRTVGCRVRPYQACETPNTCAGGADCRLGRIR